MLKHKQGTPRGADLNRRTNVLDNKIWHLPDRPSSSGSQMQNRINYETPLDKEAEISFTILYRLEVFLMLEVVFFASL